ncbi:MAG: PilZ domain-containing protein [Gammaproteobacteria bacterium]|jgi:hypothetical protein|nr:PilZ domain-containing protein [Gammaproteobacteria bacterium]MBT4606412.1 PilZ domain-containing protein [Thiotrichales bacterium]MBT3966866.1 PilZ domain-containing protein [Gammaproteobacteria bacterium]MBT4081921.1 PilZ domain-containing protein [Gammaproteobacteria bacterium]MBT4330189.1 PilZ domain-containing protein [Gammaproteobacteria bacterium]
MTEHRNHHRVHFDYIVDFEFDKQRHTCELFDISLRGALIGACTGATPEAGTPCKLIIKLDATEQTKIVMFGSIAHKKENRVGIICEEIDIDSMTHLRKLVEYNLGDVELVNRELDALREQ